MSKCSLVTWHHNALLRSPPPKLRYKVSNGRLAQQRVIHRIHQKRRLLRNQLQRAQQGSQLPVPPPLIQHHANALWHRRAHQLGVTPDHHNGPSNFAAVRNGNLDCCLPSKPRQRLRKWQFIRRSRRQNDGNNSFASLHGVNASINDAPAKFQCWVVSQFAFLGS